MKMFVWSQKPSFIAVAQASSVAEARDALLKTDLGDSGDGSCPVHDRARNVILSDNPTIWYGPNAEFAITDSAEVEELELFTRSQGKEIDKLKQQLAAMRDQRDSAAVKVSLLEVQLRDAKDIATRANWDMDTAFANLLESQELTGQLRNRVKELEAESKSWPAREAEFEAAVKRESDAASEWQIRALLAERKLERLGVTPDWQCAHGVSIAEECEECEEYNQVKP